MQDTLTSSKVLPPSYLEGASNLLKHATHDDGAGRNSVDTALEKRFVGAAQ